MDRLILSIRIRRRDFLGHLFSASSTTVIPLSSIDRYSPKDVTDPGLVLSSIAFQYYPLDLNMESNPFVVSWWPLALADPALFHVSLQTASLDEESRAQKGFPISELLMSDSVSLVRRRVEDSSLAFQDGTLDAVVTLAAIEVRAPLATVTLALHC